MLEFFRRIKKLYQWNKILWNEFDWDWVYIIELLCYKLERTRKCILSNNVIEDAQQVHDQILEVETLLREALQVDENVKLGNDKKIQAKLKKAFNLMAKNMLGWWD